jgi:hypothetical protein
MILAALPLVAGLTGCKSDDETTAKPANETLIVEGGDITFSSSEDKKYVDISADCSWHVVDFQVTDDSGIIDETKSQRGDFGDKLMVEPMRGSGNSTITISIDKNGGTLKRGNAYIILQSDGGLRQRINITQLSNDPGMSIAGTTDGGLDFTMAGGVKTLTIESNTSWTIETQYNGIATDWITLSKTSGSGNDYVTVTVPAETTGNDRDATLIFKYSNKVASVMIRQGAKTDISLSVDKENLVFSPAYYIPDNEHEREHYQHMMEDQGSWERQTVKVTTNASWRVSIPAGESWLKLDSDGGVGNGEFTVMCSPYTTSTQKRMSVIMVVAGAKTNYVFVNQAVEGYSEDKLDVLTLYSMSVFNNYANFRFDFVYGEEGNYDRTGDYGVVYSTESHEPNVNNGTKVVAGSGKTSGGVGVEVKNLEPETTYYVRGFVYGNNGVKYTPNVVTIKTSSSTTLPGESDNPDPQLSRSLAARRRY